MTYEEALDILLETIMPVDKENEALEKALEALRKQIPERPNIEHQPICDLYKCPICDKLLIIYYPGMELFTGEETEFCDKCGQAIDWSDER